MGSWPHAPAPPPGTPERWTEDNSELVTAISEVHEIRRNTSTGELFNYVRTYFGNGENSIGDVGQYSGAIMKTVNGGANWTVQFKDTGRFYFNGIHCSSETKCVAVAEGHNCATPGSYIYVTEDGGENWSLQHHESGGTFTLMGVRMVSDTEVFVVGGNGAGLQHGTFYHSLNGGYDWDTNTTMIGLMPMSIDCFDGSHCFAAATTITQQCTLVAFK